MKRFFPLLLGLTLICLSFSTNNSELNSCDDTAANSLIKICDHKPTPLTNQNQCSPYAAELVIDQATCTGTMKAYLRVANLDDNPILGESYNLPNGLGGMFYEYTYGGNTYTTSEINSFVYEYNRGTHPIYEWSGDITFDLTGYCGASTTEIFFNVRITDQNGADYDLVGNSEPHEIFNCHLFEESCYYCSGSGCASPGDLKYNVLACGDACNQCQTGKLDAIENNIATSSQTLEEETKYIVEYNEDFYATTIIPETEYSRNLNVEVSPNPFVNNIELTFHETVNANLSIELINPNGKVMLNKKIDSNVDKSINLDVDYLPSGIYYCRVINGDKIFTQKVVKL